MSTGAIPEESGRIAQVILQHAARIAREQHIPMLMQLSADLARDITSADRCSLWLLDKQRDELWTKVAHGINMIRIPAGHGIVGKCVTENRTIVVNDVSTSGDFLQSVDRSSSYQTKSVVCVPIRSDDEVIGALQLLNKPNGFSENDAEMLQFIALYAASAIQTERLRKDAEAARFLRHELEIARDVQRRLFPQKLADVPGIDYTGLCRPARSVGGDYYDFVELAGAQFALTLGDVSGKGIPAALLMASIHTLLHSMLLHDSGHLERLAAELSVAVQRNSASERYSTLFCGVLDAQRTELRYINAGHVPPLVVRTYGGIEIPADGDAPIGLLPGVIFTQHRIALAPGDAVVCISDGILDLDESATAWGIDDLKAVLYQYRNAAVQEIAEAVFQAVDRCCGEAEQFDDMTVIVVRTLPK